MATISKIGKPKIYTESDQILKDLKDELAHLKSRMNLIEEEQEQNRSQLEQLSLHQDFTNELITSQQEEIKINKENYRVIANVMQNLKSPVSDVVDNLADIIPTIDDKDAQETLRDCMNTANKVLSSFSEVEDFCTEVSAEFNISQQTVEIKEFFRQVLYDVQSDTKIKDQHTVQMFIEKNVPERKPLYIETIRICMVSLINELINRISNSNLKITIATERSGEKYGIDISDLTVLIEANQLTDLKWQDSWIKAIQQNQNKLMNSGFNLLKMRDYLRKTGGQLKIVETNGNIRGFKFYVPLTY